MNIPEFTQPPSESKGYIYAALKTMNWARVLTLMLRKLVKKGNGNPEDRKHFAD